MARDRAKINTGIWGDADWKALPALQKYLYITLLTRPELNRVGVTEWRPGRLAALGPDTTADDIRALGAGLQDQRFILIDENTEEVLIRSFLKHDGVLDNPNLGATIKSAYDSIYSVPIQQVVIHELTKLADREPDLPVLKSEKSRRYISAMLDLPGSPIEDYLDGVGDEVQDGNERRSNSVPNGVGNGVPNASTTAFERVGGTAFKKGDPSTTATTTPSKEGMWAQAQAPKKPETPLPDDWTPTPEHRKRADEKHLELNEVADSFRAHAEAKDRRAVNWNAAFTQWLIKEKPGTPSKPAFDPWTASHDDYLHPEERAEIEQRRTHQANTPDDPPF